MYCQQLFNFFYFYFLVNKKYRFIDKKRGVYDNERKQKSLIKRVIYNVKKKNLNNSQK